MTASYGYDPLGNLVSQTVNGATTNFQIDPTGSATSSPTFGSGGTVIAHLHVRPRPDQPGQCERDRRLLRLQQHRLDSRHHGTRAEVTSTSTLLAVRGDDNHSGDTAERFQYVGQSGDECDFGQHGPYAE